MSPSYFWMWLSWENEVNNRQKGHLLASSSRLFDTKAECREDGLAAEISVPPSTWGGPVLIVEHIDNMKWFFNFFKFQNYDGDQEMIDLQD